MKSFVGLKFLRSMIKASGPRQSHEPKNQDAAKFDCLMFRLERGLLEASICLRCRYRLRLRRQLRIQNQPSPQQPRHFGLGRRINQEQAELSKVRYDIESAESPISYHYYGKQASTRHLDIFGHPRRPPPRGRLGVNSLGQPAEVLILRERQSKQDNAEYDMDDQSAKEGDTLATKAPSSSEMLDEINKERGIIDPAQVCENIDNVKDEWLGTANRSRPISAGIVTTEEYEHISSKLRQGFTNNQLTLYLKRNLTRLPLDPLDLGHEYSSNLYSRSSWNPIRIDPPGTRVLDTAGIDEDEVPYVSNIRQKPEKQMPRKRALVDRILRLCWQIRSIEDESLLGRMDVKLQLPHLQLLVNHERGILKQISETYNAKLEASVQDQRVRVTSEYEASLDILKLIIHTLKSIKSAEVEFSPEPSLEVRSSAKHETYENILRHIMQSTNTVIKLRVSNQWEQGLVVYYLGPSGDDIEDVRRLIGQTMMKALGKHELLLVGRRNKKSKMLFVPAEVGNRLSLANRSQQWSRWCSRSIRSLPIRIMDSSNEREEAPSRPNILENPLDEKKIARTLNGFLAIPDDHHTITGIAEKTRPHWTSNITYRDSAILGQVLFPLPISNTEKTSVAQPKDKGPREFLTLVPGLVNSLENLALGNSVTKSRNEESLLICLTPSPKNNLSIPLEAIPDLEIQILLDSSSQPTSTHVVRLVCKKELDLLLPQNTTDIRFVRRSCVSSRDGGLDPAIEQFIRKSNLDIGGTDRLKTPSDLTLSIPSHALDPTQISPIPEAFKNEKVQYTFASLEHRSDIGIPFYHPGSWAELTYTNIEAGKIGGRSDELVLTQRRQPKQAIRGDEDGSEDSDFQAPTDETVTDAAYASSLLSKANALIQRIENPPSSLAKNQARGGGAEKTHAQREKAGSRQEVSGRRLRELRMETGAGKGTGIVRKINT